MAAMNKKSINQIIKRKVNDWLYNIDDAELSKDIKNEIIITGGCIASMLLNEDVNDYDVYFKNKAIAKRVSEYYCKKFNDENKGHINKFGHAVSAFVLDGEDVAAYNRGEKKLSDFAQDFENQPILSRMIAGCPEDRIKIIVRSDGVATDEEHKDILDAPFENAVDIISEADNLNEKALDGLNKSKYRPIFLSSNAITLSDKIQIIVRFYGKPEEIHSNYDFAHCTNYWTYEDGVVLNIEALESLMSKHLIYKGSKYPLCSVIRTRKFIKRGFHINAGQYLKMCFQISNLDLTNIDVLEDQLVGVDSAYFIQLIDGLRSKKENDPSFEINNAYITTIIDKIF